MVIGEAPVVLDHSQEKTEPAEIDHLDWLLQRARQGEDVLPELRAWLERSAVWRQFGDLGHQAREGWLRLIAGNDIVLRESLIRKLNDLQGELPRYRPPRLRSQYILHRLPSLPTDQPNELLRGVCFASHTSGRRKEAA